MLLKVSLLKPFVFYRSKTQVILPVDMKNQKKNCLYTVLAPKTSPALAWASDWDNTFRFRQLYKYFIPKFFNEKLHASSMVRRDIGTEFQIPEFIQTLQAEGNSQLKNVEFVSMRPNASMDMLRNFNVYYETSYLLQLVLENPKDHRQLYLKMKDAIPMIAAHLHGDRRMYKADTYKENTVIIPVNLWTSEMKNVNIFRQTTKDDFGAFWFNLDTVEKFQDLFHGYRVILANHNEFMILDPETIPSDAKSSFILDNVKLFLRKCKSSDANIAIEADTPEEEQELAQVENLSKKENTTEKVISKVVPDNANIPDDTVKKVAAAVSATAKAKKARVQSTPEQKPVTGEKPAIKKATPEEPKMVSPVITSDGTEVVPDEPEIVVDQDAKKVTTAADIITQARLSGQSIGNYQRNEMLKGRLKELKIDNRPIEDVIKSEEKYIIPKKKVKANTINPAYKEITAFNFEKAYNDQLFMHDLARILLHFSKANPALYLLNDPIIEDISNDTDKLYMVTVEYEDENRKRHKFKFKLPKMYQDRYLFINEQKWNIIHQKTPFPVTKIGPDRAQVASNYNKIMLERYGQNISSKITKLKKILEGPNCPPGIKTVRGNNSQLNKSNLTTIEYDELGNRFSTISTSGLTIYFSIAEASAVIPPATSAIKDKTVYPLAANRRAGTYYYLSGTSNTVYDQDGNTHGELSDWIIETISKTHKDFKDQFDDTSAGNKFMYVRGKIMGTWIPLILILCAADPEGLVAVLNKAKIKYEFVSSRPKNLDTDNYGIVSFTDGYLIYERYPYENSLLLNGLSVIPSKTYSFYDMGNRDTYVELFDILYDRRNLIDGIENFYYLEIDPITEDVLEHLGMPTEFTSLLLYANGIMADNSYNMDSDYDQSRLRSNEIILARLYDLLCKAYAEYRRGEKFSIREDELIKALLTERIVDAHSKLNVALELENDNQVKLKGPHGMNEERSFTLEKRAFHPSMRGIIGSNSTYSGEVGIGRHMSLNANIIDARGFVQINKPDYDGTELQTPGELLNAFDAESADQERVAMAVSQTKQYVPVADSSPTLVSYDMERIAPYLSSDYAVTSKKSGVVKEIANDIMIIQYDDGTYEDIDLSEHADKNTDGGFYVMNRMKTDLAVGQRFEDNQIIAYDPKYISEKDMFGDNLVDTGTLARVAIVMNGAVYEDATYLTENLAERMTAKITTDKTVHLSRFSNIKKIVKKGQRVQANDALLYFEEADDMFTSQMLRQLADEAEDEDEISATAAPVFSKVTGVVKDIKIYYTCELEEMSPSLQKLIKQYNAEVSKRHKTIEKYMDPRDATSIIPPCTSVVPDSTGRVKGKKMPKDIMIEFYIEYDDKYKLGDKISHMYALKGICSYIIPKGQEAFTDFNPEKKIDAYLSAFGLFKRMVFSLEKVGSLTKILVEKKRLMRDKYLERLQEELNK